MTAALHITGLTAGYASEPVLKEISLDVPAGEWVALLGPNGSGKSTLLYCIAGMLRPVAGDIQICGHSLSNEARVAKGFLGYGCAPERLPGLLTGRQCLEVHVAAKGHQNLDPEVLELIDIFALTRMLDQFVDTYSLGTRQKLAVLLALIGSPRLIVLDEAFNGLDPASARALKRHLRGVVDAGRASVLLATHALDVVERYADRAALLLSGTLSRVWTKPEIAALRECPDGLEDAIAAAPITSASPPSGSRLRSLR